MAAAGPSQAVRDQVLAAADALATRPPSKPLDESLGAMHPSKTSDVTTLVIPLPIVTSVVGVAITGKSR